MADRREEEEGKTRQGKRENIKKAVGERKEEKERKTDGENEIFVKG